MMQTETIPDVYEAEIIELTHLIAQCRSEYRKLSRKRIELEALCKRDDVAALLKRIENSGLIMESVLDKIEEACARRMLLH